jgi:hypothetical protein
MTDLGQLHRITAIADRQAMIREALARQGRELAPDDPIFDFGRVSPEVL